MLSGKNKCQEFLSIHLHHSEDFPQIFQYFFLSRKPWMAQGIWEGARQARIIQESLRMKFKRHVNQTVQKMLRTFFYLEKREHFYI